MKAVLFFVNSLQAGGAERVCVNLAKEYFNMGYAVNIVTLFKRDCTIMQDVQFKEYCLGVNDKLSKQKIIVQICRQKRKINQFIKQINQVNRIELIQAHLPLSHICASLSCVSKQCMYVQHTSLLREDRKVEWYQLFYRNKLNCCVSNGLRMEFLNAMKFDSKKVKIIYNPIPIDDIRLTSNEKVENGRPYILCVGRLNPQKRFDRAIETFYLGKFYEKYDLVFIGEGTEKSALNALAEKYGITNQVIFKGWQENAYRWMKSAEVLLHTSEREALPMVLLEALACGTKVVASNCEYGADEILQGKLQEYVVEQDDIMAYIDKLKKAIDGYPCECMEDIVGRFEVSKIAKEYLDEYAKYFELGETYG